MGGYSTAFVSNFNLKVMQCNEGKVVSFTPQRMVFGTAVVSSSYPKTHLSSTEYHGPHLPNCGSKKSPLGQSSDILRPFTHHTYRSQLPGCALCVGPTRQSKGSAIEMRHHFNLQVQMGKFDLFHIRLPYQRTDMTLGMRRRMCHLEGPRMFHRSDMDHSDTDLQTTSTRKVVNDRNDNFVIDAEFEVGSIEIQRTGIRSWGFVHL